MHAVSRKADHGRREALVAEELADIVGDNLCGLHLGIRGVCAGRPHNINVYQTPIAANDVARRCRNRSELDAVALNAVVARFVDAIEREVYLAVIIRRYGRKDCLYIREVARIDFLSVACRRVNDANLHQLVIGFEHIVPHSDDIRFHYLYSDEG